MRAFILIFLTFITISSCTGNLQMSRLKEIEAYVNEHPDSARAVLESLDTASFHGRKEKAKYALLYSMSLDKTFSDTSDVGIIRPAVNYYRNHGSESDYMKSLYYLGRFYANSGDWRNAIIYYKEAEAVSNKADDYYKAVLYSAIAEVYNVNADRNEELNYILKEYDIAKRLGSKTVERIATQELAQAYQNNGATAKADSLYQRLLRGSERDEVYLQTLLKAAHNDATRTPASPESSARYYSEAIKMGANLSVEQRYEYCYTLLLLGQDDKAMYLLSSMPEHPETIMTNWWKYKIYEENGNAVGAIKYLRKYCYGLEEKFFCAQKAAIDRALAAYGNMKVGVAAHKAKERMYLWLLTAAAAIIIVGMLFFVYNQYKRTEEKEKRTLLGRLSSLGKSVIRIRKTSYGDTVWSMARRGLAGLPELEKELDAAFDNIIRKIRNEHPKIKEKEIQYICYTILGMDTVSIIAITGDSKDNARQIRKRVKDKVLSTASPYHDLYEAMLGKS